MPGKVHIIFDFWQTLWDPDPTKDDLQRIAKETLLSQKTISEESLTLLSRELGGAFFVGTLTFLRLLRPYATFDIVTQSDQVFVKRALESWGIEHYFSTILSSHIDPSNYKSLKEAPSSKTDLLKKQLEQLGGKTVVCIGDSASDAKMAQTLGIPFVHKASKLFGIDSSEGKNLENWAKEGLLEGSDPAFLRRFPKTLCSSGDFFKIARFFLWRYAGFSELDFTGRSSSIWGVNKEMDSIPAPQKLSKPKIPHDGKSLTK